MRPIHIATDADVAETVLMPGDPLRAKYMANKFLENPTCYTEVRNMLGFTGYYKGMKVSIQGSGMGMPSFSIYANELIQAYGVKRIIRIGSCGSLQENLELGDIVLAQAACTDSGMNRRRFAGMDYAPIADFPTLLTAYELAQSMDLPVNVGNVISFDNFYEPEKDQTRELWRKYKVLAVDMESAELYTLAAYYDVQALTMLTVSDQTLTKKRHSAAEREKAYTDMVKLALETSLKISQ